MALRVSLVAVTVAYLDKWIETVVRAKPRMSKYPI